MEKRIATVKDFKVGTVLFDSEGNSFVLRNKYSNGIWESMFKVHFESEAKFYKVSI